jgi:hypothetical protein
MLTHKEECLGPFAKSTVVKYTHLAIQLFNERFKHLIHDRWDWEAYFDGLCIHDYYVRWFFTTNDLETTTYI